MQEIQAKKKQLRTKGVKQKRKKKSDKGERIETPASTSNTTPTASSSSQLQSTWAPLATNSFSNDPYSPLTTVSGLDPFASQWQTPNFPDLACGSPATMSSHSALHDHHIGPHFAPHIGTGTLHSGAVTAQHSDSYRFPFDIPGPSSLAMPNAQHEPIPYGQHAFMNAHSESTPYGQHAFDSSSTYYMPDPQDYYRS